ncbi:MAG: zf-TFIIB domain-containing protein [Phycisphaerae bacterium]|nr:zf-TFIIB domain-containing protein [Phycisphaerae bacterium]
MKLVPGRDYFVCEYCTTFGFPAKSKDGVSVTVLGDVSDLNCPVCAVNLVPAAVAGHEVLYCTRCRGMLASNTNFGDIVASLRATYEQSDERKPRPIDPSEFKRHLRCPHCEQDFDTHPYYGPGNVVVDTCGECALIWLDHGELDVIRRAPGRR